MALEPWHLAAAAIATLAGSGGYLVFGGARRGGAGLAAEGAALAALAFVVGAAALAGFGAGPASGLGLVADVVSVPVGLLVTVVGWASLRFARVQLRGEPGAEPFSGWICLALAAGLLAAFSDHIALLGLGWALGGLALHAPIRFRADRPASRRAAWSKFWIDRASEALLAAAILILWTRVGDGGFAAIARAAPTLGGWGGAAAALIAAAVVLRSAQAPFHGWLLDLLEAPTPVSAVLHAGLISVGGLLLMRLSPLMAEAPAVMVALALIGGANALAASLVQTVQPAAKTALVWSTIAQMGFMLLECGLGLYPLALLHILAHGVYKANAFLWASSAVRSVAAWRRLGPVAAPGPRAITAAMAAALLTYGVADALFGGPDRPLQAHALGAILVLGVGYLLAQGLADAAPLGLTLRLAVVSLVTFAAYFALQTLAWRMTGDAFAPPPPADALQMAIVALAVLTFAAVVIFQAAVPRWGRHPKLAALRVHLANGLYLDLILARLIGRAPLREI